MTTSYMRLVQAPSPEDRQNGLAHAIQWHAGAASVDDVLATARRFALFLAANPVEGEKPDPAS